MSSKIPCPHCSVENFESSAVCWQCGRPMKQQTPPNTTVQLNPQPPSQPAYGTPPPTAGPAGVNPYAYGLPIVSPQPTRPVALSVMVILTWIGAAFTVVAAILLMAYGRTLVKDMPGSGANLGALPSALTGFIVVVGIFLIVISAAQAFIAHRLWMGYSWARTVFIVLEGMAVLGGIGRVMSAAAIGQSSTIHAQSAGNAVGSFVGLAGSIVFLIILFLPQTTEYCRQ